MRSAIVIAALLGAASAASAQADGPPDPATVTLPDMTPTRDPAVIADGWRHFYFHKTGVSYERAYADFSDCYRFLASPGVVGGGFPSQRPWSEPIAPAARRPPPPNNMGLVGGIIVGLVTKTLDRRDRQSRMRRCMEPRGYVRYALKEDSWKKLIDDYSPESIAMQAKAAAGPSPNLPEVTR
jgi:hypothetical protein